jgi:hypothetical protein
MRNISFAQQALERISNIRSVRYSVEETNHFQIELLGAIRTRLSVIAPMEGYHEYRRGPWANTRRVLVFGYKVYYTYSKGTDEIIVKTIKPPGMN